MKIQALSSNLFLVIVSLLLTFTVLEVTARIYLVYFATSDRFSKYASAKQLEAHYKTQKFITHRLLGYIPTPNYNNPPNKHNTLGFRGDEILLPKPEGTYRIVTLGGSTTYSDGVADYTKSYPVLLQNYLYEKGVTNVNVVNAGVPGYTSLETLINLEVRVLDLNPDLIIIYHAVNDVHARLVWPPTAYRGDNSGSIASTVRSQIPSILEHSTLLRIFLVKLGITRSHNTLIYLTNAPDTSYAFLLNTQRVNGTYPAGIFQDVSAKTMLETNKPVYFERNLKNIIYMAQNNNIDILLTTFTYNPSFPNSSSSYPEYQTAIDEENEIIRTIANTTETYLFDLANLMPTKKEYYTDGYHFTETGNKLRAKLIGTFILETFNLNTANLESSQRDQPKPIFTH